MPAGLYDAHYDLTGGPKDQVPLPLEVTNGWMKTNDTRSGQAMPRYSVYTLALMHDVASHHTLEEGRLAADSRSSTGMELVSYL